MYVIIFIDISRLFLFGKGELRMSEKRRDNKNRILQTGESQRKDGRYAYKYVDGYGKPQFVYAWKLVPTDKTPAGKRDDISLREKEKQIRKDLDDGIDTKGGKMTVLELYDKRINQNANVKEATVLNRNQLRNILENDAFGRMAIEKVKMSDAKEWLIRLRKNGYAYSTVKNHKRSMSAVFYIAVVDDCIRKNPFHFDIRELIENDTEPSIPLSKEQEKAFLDFVQHHKRYCKFYDDFLVLLGTGLRISELCGLTLNDLDFNNQLIDVNHQLVGNKKSGFSITSPKTQKSYRQIPMSKTVYQALQNILARPRPEPYEIDGHKDFIFFNHRGVPRNSKSYRGALDKIVEKYEETDGIELPTISPHIFRHTFCTNMANKGMNPKALQYIMGHKNIKITLDYYAHATSASAKEEMERVMAM